MHTRTLCVFRMNNMWSEFSVCNIVTLTEASHNKAPLSALKFKQMAWSLWLQFSIHVGQKVRLIEQTIHCSTAFDDFSLIKAFIYSGMEQNLPGIECVRDEKAEHLPV